MEYRGSSVEIDPETIIRLEDGEMILDHGSVTVTSFQQFRVHAGCVTATPVNVEKTVYFVKDTDGRVTVFAQQHDVNLDSRSTNLKRTSQPESSGHTVVHQGEQKSREEHCGGADIQTTAGATEGIMNSWGAVAAGGAVVVGGTLCILLCFNNAPASPCSPSQSSGTCNHP
jgi:ferric-dicitrate binding protein FerR (iron transport regulator)